MPVSCERGVLIRRALEDVLSEISGLESRCLRALGSDMNEAGPTTQDVASARKALTNLLPGAGPAPPWNHHFPTPVDHVLLAALRSWMVDPDDQPERWLRFGAPAGLACIPLTRSIFPSMDHVPISDPCDLCVDENRFANYAGVDQDEVAQGEVFDLHRRGLLEAFNSINEVQNYLGQRPVLSKVGVITKIVGNKMKKRVIVDSLRSSVSDSTTKPERSVLPRVLDVVDDFMVQRLSAYHKESTDFVVLDFTSAFFIIPLAWEERRFFLIRLRGKFFVFKVCAQGAAASPMVWARTAALVSRLTQYMFLETDLAIEVFVDDPCLTVTGSLAHRNKNIAIVILFWRTLGFPLQFKKGQRGQTVNWIGFTLQSTDTELVVSIKPEILDEFRSQIASAFKGNVISKRELQKLAGRANYVAGMIPTWRPFLQELWGALANDGGNAPPNCVWTSQIKSLMTWLDLFLDGLGGTLICTFSLDTWSNVAQPILITLDASPWGLGGIIEVQDNVVSFFSSPLSETDSQILGHTIGEASGQQVSESLCALVALRSWKSYWTRNHTKLLSRGDSVTMLCLRPSRSPGLGLLARELALDLAEGVYQPDIAAVHIGGITNKLADWLSREAAPGRTGDRPAILQNSSETVILPRQRSWYRTLKPLLPARKEWG